MNAPATLAREQLVRRFGNLMLEKLSERTSKGSWSGTQKSAMVALLIGEVAELCASVVANEDPKMIARECADVANYCAMLADIVGGLGD